MRNAMWVGGGITGMGMDRQFNSSRCQRIVRIT